MKKKSSSGRMPLAGKIAVVTGASRGVGRGIALQLGAKGATVYITGRRPQESLSSSSKIHGLEQTAREISARGGKGIPVFVDHSDMNDVKRFFEILENDTKGELDIMVNNAYSGVPYLAPNMDKKFYESEPNLWDQFNNVGLRNHYVCSVYAARLMVPRRSGLIVNVSSLGGLFPLFNVPYGVGKGALDRMTRDMHEHLKGTNVSIMSLWPGAVKTELCMDAVEHNGIKEEMVKDFFLKGETCDFVGKAVAALAEHGNHRKYSGKVAFTVDIAEEYGFCEDDGTIPPNMHALKNFLILGGKSKLAKFVPASIKTPGWLMTSSVNMIL